jgi:SBP domain
VISEFDDAKRSCRRRLAGHNERRRKSNAHESIMRNSMHSLAIGWLILFSFFLCQLPCLEFWILKHFPLNFKAAQISK